MLSLGRIFYSNQLLDLRFHLRPESIFHFCRINEPIHLHWTTQWNRRCGDHTVVVICLIWVQSRHSQKLAFDILECYTITPSIMVKFVGTPAQMSNICLQRAKRRQKVTLWCVTDYKNYSLCLFTWKSSGKAWRLKARPPINASLSGSSEITSSVTLTLTVLAVIWTFPSAPKCLK